jgi:hypothetical protein
LLEVSANIDVIVICLLPFSAAPFLDRDEAEVQEEKSFNISLIKIAFEKCTSMKDVMQVSLRT